MVLPFTTNGLSFAGVFSGPVRAVTAPRWKSTGKWQCVNGLSQNSLGDVLNKYWKNLKKIVENSSKFREN